MKHKRSQLIPILGGLALFTTSCEQVIEVELPDVEQELVVEGRIETGAAPVVWLGRTQGYFEPLDFALSGDFFLGGATVTLERSGGEVVVLDAVCSADLPADILSDLATAVGLPEALLASANLCFYTAFDLGWAGEAGETYRLEVTLDGETARATTHIPQPVPMDSVWFDSPGPPDSLGIAYARFSDPDTLGNAYRWFARRINRRPAWDPNAGAVKDADFIAPLGSVIDDEFFNGLTFEFSAFRGVQAGSTAPEDQFDSPEFAYFKVGDTVVVKTCTMDRRVYLALASYESAILGQGSPFTVPADMLTNVEGGRGLFAGYAASLDTIIYTP